jgi:O-antigen ligase
VSAALVALGLGALAAAIAVALIAFSERFGNASPAVALGLAAAPAVIIGVLRSPVLGVVLIFLSFFVGARQLSTPLVSLQLVELTVLAVALLFVLRRLAAARAPLPWPAPLWWPAILVGWAVVGLPWAVDETLALKQIASLAGGIVVACLVVGAATSLKALSQILTALAAVTASISLFALSSGVHFQTTSETGAVGGRLTGVFEHPNQLGCLCMLVTPIAMTLLLAARSWWGRLAYFVMLAAALFGVVLSLSRGAWIGTALAVLFLLITLREARRAALAVAVVLLVGAVFLGSVSHANPDFQVLGQRFQELTAVNPYDDRPAIYSEAWREIRENPLIGVGAGGFPVASERAGSGVSTISAEHAHNLFLNWAAEAGIPAVLFIVGFIISLGVASHRAARVFAAAGKRRHRIIVAGVTAGLLAMLGQGLVDYTLRNAVVFVALWAVIGALLACTRLAARSREEAGLSDR